MNDASLPDRGLRTALVAGTTDFAHPVGGSSSCAGELIAQLAAHGAPGFEVDLLGIGQLVDATATRHYDVIHIASPPATALSAIHVAHTIGVPSVTICDDIADRELAAVYSACEAVLSPSPAVDAALIGVGVMPDRIERWRRGVDVRQFNPARYAPDALKAAGRFNVLHAGPLDDRSSIQLLAESFLVARDRQPRLHLVLAGSGAVPPGLAARLGAAATIRAGAVGDHLAQLFASADLFVSTTQFDIPGSGIAEAHASGVPVLAVDCLDAAALIENGRSGVLLPPDPAALAFALRWLARRGAVCERLATGGLLAVRERTWETSLDRLAACWRGAVERAWHPVRLEVHRAA